MSEQFFTHEFDNGLTLVAQRMEQVSSAAMTWALPAGAAHDPAGGSGAAAVATNWLLRGAGDRDTRALNDALDAMGWHHGESAQNEHLVLSAAGLGKDLAAVLALYGDILRRPRLTDEDFAHCRDLAHQALESLQDEPMRMCGLLIRERHYPCPLGRNPMGSAPDLEAMTPKPLRDHLGRHLTPRGAILAVAGKFDWADLLEAVGEHFGGWAGQPPPEVLVTPATGGVTHLTKPTAQAQITLAYAAPPISEPSYYSVRVGQMVLSGGMSSRLFTEVREKRGLVYAVAARYHSLKNHAGIFVYAGTTPGRAAETLKVTLTELRKLADGVAEDEIARARTQLKSALVMQGESTGARADALASDFYHLRRLRSLAEISAAIDAVTADDVLACARAWPAKKLTMLTIGPEKIDADQILESP